MRYFAFITLISLLGTLTGCDRYLVTFNEQAVYTPPTLFTGYDINDPALRSCVAQTIVDGRIHRAKNLTILTLHLITLLIWTYRLFPPCRN